MSPLPAAAAAKPNLNHIECWVFDLDNTLYPASTNLFAEIDRRMARFIGDRLGVEPAEARRIQKLYFEGYGTTLRGLMINHRVDPDHFLSYVHAVDLSVLSPDPGLESALARLPGPKIVFTNGSASHAEKVMARLGVAEHFDGVFDIAAARYCSKPDPEAYRALIRRHDLRPRATAIFEDLPRNLRPAAALGMTTVWVRNRSPWAETPAAGGDEQDFIHHETEDLVAWLKTVIAARAEEPARR